MQRPAVLTVDAEERISDFFARHGGAAMREEREGDTALHSDGWSEIYAADGYRLRCDWTKTGGRIEMRFSEMPPN